MRTAIQDAIETIDTWGDSDAGESVLLSAAERLAKTIKESQTRTCSNCIWWTYNHPQGTNPNRGVCEFVNSIQSEQVPLMSMSVEAYADDDQGLHAGASDGTRLRLRPFRTVHKRGHKIIRWPAK